MKMWWWGEGSRAGILRRGGKEAEHDGEGQVKMDQKRDETKEEKWAPESNLRWVDSIVIQMYLHDLTVMCHD